MKCPRCQREGVPSDAVFCSQCGTKLSVACPRCGATSASGDNFCRTCGQQLAATESSTPTRFGSPESYTPRYLAEKIAASKIAVEGERKQVTVLFADLKDSMELLADRDPEDARKILDPVLDLMMEAVHRYEGTVNQVMGDGIMALFGAPIAHEDHAERACYAALRMQEALGKYSDEIRRAGGVAVHIRIGLNSGEVVVREIQSDLRTDYTAVGQTTHLAARMEQIATPGSILLTLETLRLVEGHVQVKSIGSVNVKGLNVPVEVYELTGGVTAPSRFQVLAARGLTKFVGRIDEMQQLVEALARARTGSGQVVAVVGEPGVGKSRLFWEFTHSARAAAWLVVSAGARSWGKATSYLPVIDLLRTYFKIDTRDDPRSIQEKVTGKLLSLDRSLKSSLSPLLALLDVPPDDESWMGLDPPQRRQRTLEAVKRLLLRESQVQPVLAIFEDLQSIDSETQALLNTLVESLPAAKLLLLVNYRPEYQHGWSGKTYYGQVRIDPLPTESLDELLSTIVGTDRDLEVLKRQLIERTEGNPFFLEESVRTLVETDVLVGERGAYRLGKPLRGLQIPATAQAILAARIDRLQPEQKRLLQAAAVIGGVVPFALLQAIAEVPDDDVRRGLTHLQATEFLYETRLFPDLEYTFKHALTHDVAYASLLHERRRTLHTQIVAAMERVYATGPGDHVERLARHALQGELWEKAATYSREAGEKAMARSAYRQAEHWFEQALGTLAHLPDDRSTIEQGIDVRLDVRRALLPLANRRKVIQLLTEAEGLARALGDQKRLAWIYDYMANALIWIGDHEHGIAYAELAAPIAEACGDEPLQIRTRFDLSIGHYSRGDYPRAAAYSQENIALLVGEQLHRRLGSLQLTSVLARSIFALAAAERGAFAEGLACATEALRLADLVGQPIDCAVASWGVGLVLLRQGAVEDAVRRLAPAAALCESIEIPANLPWTYCLYGYALAYAGRPDEARRFLDNGIAVAASTETLWGHPIFLVFRGEAALLDGDVERAAEDADGALRFSEERGERGHHAWALRLRAEVMSHRDNGDVVAAEHGYRRALAAATELGMRPLEGHCHSGLAQLYRRLGKLQQAQDHLQRAIVMYRNLQMQFWLQKLDAPLTGE